jgi:hypothetical protein
MKKLQPERQIKNLWHLKFGVELFVHYNYNNNKQQYTMK